ncbi:MAG TPA: hypothetical protein VLI65_05010, partial [Pyrinomonadaceae bacterium]|nr:hypothetical protein [Pyrinomonadaceae bacterium]
MLNPIVIAVPIFALMIAVEAWAASRRNLEFYSTRDAWVNILIGFISIAFGAFFGLIIGLIYTFLYELSPFKFPSDVWWSWAILFFLD